MTTVKREMSAMKLNRRRRQLLQVNIDKLCEKVCFQTFEGINIEGKSYSEEIHYKL